MLLPLCMWHLLREGVWKQERCITMTFPIPEDQRAMDPFPVRPFPSELRHEWTTFHCNGHQDHIDAVLLGFRDALRVLESVGDTTRGIHIRFGQDTKYSTIISAIDICRTTVSAWELDDHDLWTLHHPEPKPEKWKAKENVFYLECGTTWVSGCIREPKPSTAGRLKAGIDHCWRNELRPYWPVWALLLFIGALALHRTLQYRIGSPEQARKSP